MGVAGGESRLLLKVTRGYSGGSAGERTHILKSMIEARPGPFGLYPFSTNSSHSGHMASPKKATSTFCALATAAPTNRMIFILLFIFN